MLLPKKDLLLVSCLRENSRETLTNISKKIKMPISTIYDKMKEYENQFIKKHTSLIDFRKLGYDLKIHIMVKVNRDKRKRFEEFVINFPSVNNVLKINNGFDYFIEAIFKDIWEFQNFIDRFELFEVQEIEEYFVIDELKRENFLANSNYLELIKN